MLLFEWIGNKEKELRESKLYKSVEFSSVGNVNIERNMASEIFDFNKVEISMNTKVEDFIRSELTEKIKGLKITFDVVKLRCRKSESLSLYVKVS